MIRPTLTDEQIDAEFLRWDLADSYDTALAFHALDTAGKARQAFVDGLKRGALLASSPPLDAPEWHDEKPDEWTAQIEAAHPMQTGAHDAYATAMKMVGNRRSKGALVALVCWLLQRPAAVPPDTLKQALEAMKEILVEAEVADSEYDGRRYSFCTSCDANDLSRPHIEHRTACTWGKVRAAIASLQASLAAPLPFRVGWFSFRDGEWRQCSRSDEGAVAFYELPDGVALPDGAKNA